MVADDGAAFEKDECGVPAMLAVDLGDGGSKKGFRIARWGNGSAPLSFKRSGEEKSGPNEQGDQRQDENSTDHWIRPMCKLPLSKLSENVEAGFVSVNLESIYQYEHAEEG